ncbi:MAG: ABC transporter permease [Chloroflexi bacterium]|nr:ABC transporter permease [Chloroflexota bacterium]
MSDVVVVPTPSRTGPAAAGWKPTRERSPWLDVLVRLVKTKPLGLVGGVILLALILVGALAGVLAPYGYNDMSLAARLSPPSPQHWFGTDNNGRDVLSRVLYGAQISLTVGLLGAALHVLLAFLVGATSGFYGSTFDTVVQRVVDGIQAFPPLLLYLTIMSFMGGSLVALVLVLGISSGIYGSRTIRGAVIGIRDQTYVEAARALGSSGNRLLVRHILPNIIPILIIEFTLAVGRLILAEAILSFLGFGVPPPFPSWGAMLSNSGQRYMLQAPWMALWPGVALALAVFSINMFGDALRDLLDPRLRTNAV